MFATLQFAFDITAPILILLPAGVYLRQINPFGGLTIVYNIVSVWLLSAEIVAVATVLSRFTITLGLVILKMSGYL